MWSRCTEQWQQRFHRCKLSTFPSPLMSAAILWESCHPYHISADWLQRLRCTWPKERFTALKIHISGNICLRKRKVFSQTFFFNVWEAFFPLWMRNWCGILPITTLAFYLHFLPEIKTVVIFVFCLDRLVHRRNTPVTHCVESISTRWNFVVGLYSHILHTDSCTGL